MWILLFYISITCFPWMGDLCEVGWTPFQSHCYKWFPVQANYNINQALYICRKNGADLLIIDSQQEEDFIKEELNLTTSVYLGASDNDVEGTWKNFNGDDLQWTNWWSGGGAPNNLAGYGDESQENCIMRAASNSSSFSMLTGLWNDIPCNPDDSLYDLHPLLNDIDAVCERSENQVEENLNKQSQSFILRPGNYLMDYNYFNSSGDSIFDCSRACLKEFPKCVSLNYREGAGNDNCVLNYGSHREANYRLLPNTFRPNPFDLADWVYVYLK